MFLDNIFFLLVVLVLSVFSHKSAEKNDLNKEYAGPYLMFNVLQSLLKLNEDRYEALKKLNNLNNVKYLRTSTENGYDFTNLLNKLKSIFHLLSFKPNLEIEKHEDIDFFDVFYNNKYILTIPLPSKGKGVNVLRTGSEEPVPGEDKKLIDYITDNESDNDDYICGRGKLRCYLACKEAYRKSCSSYYCEYNFLVEMRNSCKDECDDRFY